MQISFVQNPWKVLKVKEIKGRVLSILTVNEDMFAVSIFSGGIVEYTYTSFRKQDVTRRFNELKKNLYDETEIS